MIFSSLDCLLQDLHMVQQSIRTTCGSLLVMMATKGSYLILLILLNVFKKKKKKKKETVASPLRHISYIVIDNKSLVFRSKGTAQW